MEKYNLSDRFNQPTLDISMNGSLLMAWTPLLGAASAVPKWKC
jgi:hypothetical protein